MSKTTDLMRERFNELSAERDRIVAASTPLREERDRIKNEALAQAALLDDQIIEIERTLADVNTDLGRLARALGGYALSTSPTAR